MAKMTPFQAQVAAEVAKRVKAQLAERQWSYQDVVRAAWSKGLRISTETVRAVVHGERVPSMTTLSALAGAFDVPESELLPVLLPEGAATRSPATDGGVRTHRVKETKGEAMRKLASLNGFMKGKGRVAAAVALISVAVVAGALVSTRQPTAAVKVAAPAGAALGANAASDPHAGPVHVGNGVMVGHDYHHDVSKALRDVKALPIKKARQPQGEAAENSALGLPHKDVADPVVQRHVGAGNIPSPILNFEGVDYPGVNCSCAPPDTNGEVGATQYVQIVNTGYQVFNKSNGNSVLGPLSIESVWSGFGGVCQTGGFGDPVVIYDQIANRWVVSQFAGTSIPTDECVAVSTSSDATGTFNRYGFHLGSNFFDYPKLSVWPDAYYMADNVFNSSGTAFLGPQPFAFNRAAMLAGSPATFVTTGITGGASENPYLPADLDGSTLPPAGAPNSFVEWPGGGSYKVFHFHVDFAVPTNTTFTLFSTVPAAGFTQLCTTTRVCVPQLGGGVGSKLDAIGDRLMFRSAYRNFGDHESVVSNYTVISGGVAGIRWFELRNVTNGPVTVAQESTYQPDTTWRWMGSVAMDRNGDMALGFSASSSSINPQIRYTGRLVTDPLNQMAQGETTLFAGTGSQVSTFNRWGDYSDMTIDPVDDCTFWYTQEYYATTSQFNWRTRIGNFTFPSCGQVALATQTKLQLRPNPVPQGGTLTFKAQVKTQGGTVPVGTVSFTVDGVQVASAAVNGQGVAQTTWVVNVGAGDHPARAIFTPTDPNAFMTSQSANVRLTVT
jgi:transcriptional regulator with XRE-family HTH domain